MVWFAWPTPPDGDDTRTVRSATCASPRANVRSLHEARSSRLGSAACCLLNGQCGSSTRCRGGMMAPLTPPPCTPAKRPSMAREAVRLPWYTLRTVTSAPPSPPHPSPPLWLAW